MDLKNLKLKGGNKKMIRMKVKQERGITLIALVVTIVVLLILAGVSINALFGNSGIIEKAKEAQNKMDKAVENDQEGINELNQWLENQVNGTSGENTTDTPSQKKIISFTIGNIAYQAEEGMKWGEWVESEYNTRGFEIEGTSIRLTEKDETGTITGNGYLCNINRNIYEYY